jgi:hypothetical protein
MKTKSIVSTLAVLVMTATMSLAMEPVNPKLVVINQEGTNVFKVIYEGAQKGDVTMNVFSKDGTKVYSETLRRVEGFIRPLNFIGMAPGEYKVEVTSETGNVIQSMNYRTQTRIDNVHIAQLSGQPKYLLSIPGRGEAVINVKVIDGLENIVHEQTLTFKGDLGLVYDTKRVFGQPTFEITDQLGNVKRIKL